MQTQVDAKVAKLAIDLYEQFYTELVTALYNTVLNWKAAAITSPDPQISARAQGRCEAYEMFLERIKKEHDLAKADLEHLIETDETKNVSDSIKFSKNLEVDSMIPDDKYRGTRDYWRIMKLKGRIADLLESYGEIGFRTGVRYARFMLNGEHAPNFKKFSIKELEGLLNSKSGYEDFSDTKL